MSNLFDRFSKYIICCVPILFDERDEEVDDEECVEVLENYNNLDA